MFGVVERVRVEVSFDDIARGIAQAVPLLTNFCEGAGRCCPVAHALMRAFPGERFRVDTTFVSFLDRKDPENPRRTLDVYLPEEARKRIVAFDQQHTMEPFSFPLEVPAGDES